MNENYDHQFQFHGCRFMRAGLYRFRITLFANHERNLKFYVDVFHHKKHTVGIRYVFKKGPIQKVYEVYTSPYVTFDTLMFQ
jgi:hypothetical protein